MTDLTIDELARATGLSKHTLRYYERAGLVPMVGRDPRSRHRRYRPDHVHWIGFVRRLRAAGMPIRDIRRYAALIPKGESGWPARRALLAEHRDRVRESIAALEAHLGILEEKLALGCSPERERREAARRDRAAAAARSVREPAGAAAE